MESLASIDVSGSFILCTQGYVEKWCLIIWQVIFTDYDVIIVGAGSGGIHAAKLLAQKGKKVALIEAKEIGGTCLNTGCIPLKILNEKDFMDAVSAMESIMTTVSYLQEGTALLINSYGVNVIQGVVTDIYDSRVRMLSGGAELFLSAEHIIIATGSKSSIPGEMLLSSQIYTAESIWSHLPEKRRVVIIGGGISGCEFAFALAGLGNQITLLERNDDILMDFPLSQREFVRAKMKQYNISVSLRHSVLKTENINDELYIYSDGEQVVSCDECLVCAGRSGYWSKEHLHVDNLKVNDSGFIEADIYGNTSEEFLFCIGDANGQKLLANYAEFQAECVVSHILGTDRDLSFASADNIPDCIFTKIQLAKIGYCPDRTTGSVVRGRAPLYAVGMATIKNCQEGEITVFRDNDTDLLVGAYVISSDASEIIHILQSYIIFKIPCHNIIEQIFAHPTICEGIKIAIEETFEGSVKLLKKRKKRIKIQHVN